MKVTSQFDNLDKALDAIAVSRKPGNGCWTLRAGQVDMWDHTRNHWTKSDRFQLTHDEPEPAPVYKKLGQRERALRKRHWANHKRWAKEGREPKAACQARMAEAYARWLCERDGVTVPAGVNHIYFDIDAVDQDAMPGASWNERKRVKAVIFAKAQTDSWGKPRIDRGYEPLLTVEIPHWDHVPQMTETTVDARAAGNFRPFAQPMSLEGAAA